MNLQVGHVSPREAAFFVNFAIQPSLAFFGHVTISGRKPFLVKTNKYEVALVVHTPHGAFEVAVVKYTLENDITFDM